VSTSFHRAMDLLLKILLLFNCPVVRVGTKLQLERNVPSMILFIQRKRVQRLYIICHIIHIDCYIDLSCYILRANHEGRINIVT